MVNRLEVVWTLATVGLIAGVAVYSTVLLYHIDTPPSHIDEYVDVVGHQWYWEFCYPANGTCYNATYDPTNNTATGGALWTKPGLEVEINVTSADVVHSFNIPGLGVRLDAIPGRVNTFAFAVPQVAVGTTYLIQCTEFCGTYHGIMRAFLVVQ
ncbi:MAG TPA: cytochrome c oxidase subunit II [Thermoplasmata archaeon]|nr:cytochrome c oxidase subunit II [Thermoplasmata archaeon]HEV2429493.1 cytochrome c oxidase subunit II [Thermoplasmata archaeon]